jgi:hypothetical protein
MFWRKHPETDKRNISIPEYIKMLLWLQVALKYRDPKDFKNIFSTLMKNKIAAGYVFGFHDSYFQIHGLTSQDNDTNYGKLLETSYKYMFGSWAATALLRLSHSWQTDHEFAIDRQSGGEDMVNFKLKGDRPMGLSSIIDFGWNAAMVERSLDNPERVTAAPR